MISLREYEARYEDLLYRLLPQIYRSRDTQEDLRKFVALFGHELARLRNNMDQLWTDFYIDSCQEWVIPYIADLVGTRILFNQGQRNRADVKNTIHWRKEKGTLGGLEDIAAEISGWGALAAEMFQRLVWSQNLNSLRPSAIQALDLSDSPAVTRLGTPFDQACRSVDIRRPDSEVGLYQTSNLAFYLWTIPSQPWVGAAPVGIGGRRYFFHPLGRDQVLYAGGDKPGACAGNPDADICFAHANDVPIRARDFRDHTDIYWGTSAGFAIYEDGILLCNPGTPVSAPSMTPSVDFAELAAQSGMLVADPGLLGIKQFRISAIRLASLTTLMNGQPVPLPVTPAGPFANNYSIDGTQANLVTPGMVYTKGLPFNPGTPDFHQPFMLIRIERLGADPDFPECELILTNSTGSALLIFLPAVTGLAMGQQMHFYVAHDGSTYFARATHDAGPIDRNPNSAFFGAFLARHLARAGAGQVRPRPGVRPLAHRTVVYRPLCCWDRALQNPPASGEVAVDPERGRFYFPAGEESSGKLSVALRFAAGGQLGAGPFSRDSLVLSTQAAVKKLSVAQTGDADHHTIQDALNAGANAIAAAKSVGLSIPTIIVEIQDSRTYHEALVVIKDFPAGLIIQSGPLEIPVVQSPAGSVLQVTGNVSNLALDGLVLAGGKVSVTGTVPDVHVRFCTLDPSSSGIDHSPAVAHSNLALDNTIAGPVTASANVDQVNVTDGSLQSLSGSPALSVPHSARLERVTVAGDTKADSIEVSNSILFGRVDIAHFETSCFRYSRFPQNTPVVRSFHCTSAYPIFLSLRLGHPGYLCLAHNTSLEIRAGGEEGGEMGVFYSAEVPWREQNVLSKLGEYMPAGLTATTMHVLPRTPFAGVKRI